MTRTVMITDSSQQKSDIYNGNAAIVHTSGNAERHMRSSIYNFSELVDCGSMWRHRTIDCSNVIEELTATLQVKSPFRSVTLFVLFLSQHLERKRSASSFEKRNRMSTFSMELCNMWYTGYRRREHCSIVCISKTCMLGEHIILSLNTVQTNKQTKYLLPCNCHSLMNLWVIFRPTLIVQTNFLYCIV